MTISLFTFVLSCAGMQMLAQSSCGDGQSDVCYDALAVNASALLQVGRAENSLQVSKVLEASSLASGTNPSGAAASLDEVGYAAVADRCCQAEMVEFIRRQAVNLNLEICSEHGLYGMAPYHSCEKGPQTFAALTSNLLSDSNERCRWVASPGSCGVRPADCPAFPGNAPKAACSCSRSGAVNFDIAAATVAHSNLGGAGPDAGAKELRYSKAGTTGAGVSFDLVVTALNSYTGLPGASLCWVRMPSGCNKALVETTTPTIWFIDNVTSASATDEATCEARMNTYNTYCGKTDATSHWATSASVDQCWVRMPSGCSKSLVETSTPATWFVDNVTAAKATDAASCEARKNTYNTFCGKGDATSHYITAQNVNGKDGKFGVITTACSDPPTDFRFSFVQQGTSTPVILPEVHMAIFDIDGKDPNGIEIVASRGYKGFISDANSDVVASRLASSYYEMGEGACCCPSGGEIQSEEECAKAHEALGLKHDKVWKGNLSSIPGGCSTRQSGDHNMHWNEQAGVTVARPDMTPVCKSVGRTKFSSGQAVDNAPNPSDPDTVTQEQKKNSIMYFYTNVTNFDVTFGIEKCVYAREMLFAGKSAMNDRCAA